MCKVIEIILLACVAQAETNAKDSMEDLIDQLNTNDDLVNQLVDKLVNRALEAVKQQDMDDATLAKTHRALFDRTTVTVNAPAPPPMQPNAAAPSPPLASSTPTSPTGNATLDNILEAKWAPKIAAGPHSCTAEDKEAIMKMPHGHGDDSWGAIITDCAHEGLNVIFGINQQTVASCLAKKITLTPKCAKCYTGMTEYDFQSCKVQCLTTWCSAACISCNHGSNVMGCIGFVDPQPTVCSGPLMGEYIEYDPNMTSDVSFAGMALMGLCMFSAAVICSVLYFSWRSSLAYPKKEPLIGAYQ